MSCELLPAGIRDAVAQYARVPGKICLPQTLLVGTDNLLKTFGKPEPGDPPSNFRQQVERTAYRWTRATVRKLLQLIGLPELPVSHKDVSAGLLAVSRQTYFEGCAKYRSLNTFFLPRGPVSHSHAYSTTVQRKHRQLIKSRVQFSLADLSIDVLNHIEYNANRFQMHHLRARIDVRGFDIDWSVYVEIYMWQIWVAKLRWIGQWQNLDGVIIDAENAEPLVLRGSIHGFLLHRRFPSRGQEGPLSEDHLKVLDLLDGADLAAGRRARTKICEIG